VHIELSIQILDVAGHGVRRDSQSLADLHVTAAIGQQPHHVNFA